MQALKDFFTEHPKVRTMTRVFTYTFLAVFLPSTLGWFADIQQWASSEDMAFPSVEPIAKAAAAAVAGAFAAIFSGIWNALPKTRSAEYPNPPKK